MYDYRCKKCIHHGHCMSMMNMPMPNMSMMNMPMANMPMMNMPMANMPMMNMPMANMPMETMPMYEEDNEDLIVMYPKVYIRMYPIVKHQHNMIVAKHGKMYCPTEDEMDCMCKEICDKYKEHHRGEDIGEDIDGEYNDDGMRRYGRGGLGDIARILLIGNLLSGRYY